MSSRKKTKTTSFEFTRTSPVQVKMKKPIRYNSTSFSTLKKSTPNKVKGRSQKQNIKATKKPFIPPPGKTSPARPMSWESKSHRLEVNPPFTSTRSKTMYMDELSSTEEDDLEAPTKYEKKIDQLLKDVSISEREYLKSKTEEQLIASRRLLEDQEDEIQAYRTDLSTSIHDKSKLERSYELARKQAEMSKTEAIVLGQEKNTLLRKLMDVETEGKQASRELNKLKETCRRLRKDQQFSEVDIKTLSNQRDMLLDKLDEFELANKNLRSLLKETQNQQISDEHLNDRCNILMRKLTNAEAKIQNQSAQLVDQDKQIDKLIAQIESDKRQTKVLEDAQRTVDATNEHLQKQLRQKELEFEQLRLAFDKLRQESSAHNVELEHYQGILTATRDKSLRDKEALKKATRIQRERAQKVEESNENLQKEVNKLLLELDESKTSLERFTELQKAMKEEKEFLEEEAKILRKHILDIGDTLELSAKTIKAGPVHVVEKLTNKVRHLKSVKLENENLKDELKTLEDNLHSNDKEYSFKVRTSETEISKLRAALDQYETLATEYKSQLEHYRNECNELHNKIRRQDDDMNAKLKESIHEVNDVRTSLQSKILELEPYPELLKNSEIRLQESQDRVSVSEQKLSEQTHIIAELTQKIEMLTDQLDHLREKYRSKHDDCKHFEQQVQSMERQMQSADGSQRELIQSLGRKDENLSILQERFDSQRVENERLIHQLEVALSDAKKQAETQKEKSVAKERSAQARIMDLESQLSRSTQNTQLLKRSKDEAEKKFNSRLQDMRDRLEQANTTTRSMQSYVQFLKSTYANVFSEDIDSAHRY